MLFLSLNAIQNLLVGVKLTEPSELDDLMSAEEYKAYIKGEKE